MKSRKQPFGELLKKLRLSRGLTQRQLAEQTGLAQSEISRLESRTTMPGSYRTMTRLIALFPELDPNFDTKARSKPPT